MLLLSLWTPALAFPAASIVILLMLGAVSIHIKVKDSIMKTVPAASMLIMSVAICSSL